MSFPLKPSKRPYDRSPVELNGKGKRQKASGFNPQLQPLKISPGSTVFRILCPNSKSGSVIGKGGSIISKIRHETGVKVRVEESLPGDDERVIVIVGPEKEVEVRNKNNREDGKEDNILDKADEAVEEEEENADKISSPIVDSTTEKGLSSAQKALFLVYERIIEGEPEYEEEVEESKKPASFVLRLLVPSSQVSCILGKGEKMIKQMAAESGAEIRVLPKDELPNCASTVDDLVQLTGGLAAVRKALHLISKQLVSNPPHEVLLTTKAIGPSSNPSLPLSKPLTNQPPNYQFLSQAALYSLPPDRSDYHLNGRQPILNHRDTVVSGRMRPSIDISFRLLCHNEKVGGIVGMGGATMKMIHHETGCDIRVLEGPIGSQDSVIVVSGPVHPDDRVSAVQDAVLRVQGRILAAAPEISEKVARFLVSMEQLRCLLGNIGEMRRLSGAYIHIVPRDQLSKFMPENEEVVQITGGFETVQEAILQVTSRLRHHHIFGDTLPSAGHPPLSAFRDQGPSFPYLGRRESSPPGLYGGLGSLPPLHGRIRAHDDRPGFARSLPMQGIHYGSGRAPASVPWEPQGVSDVGRPMGIPEYSGGVPQRKIGGVGSGSGNQPTMITSTTVEVAVPRSVVPSIYGEDGSSLKQIRQISGANITITDPKPGATETKIIISGTPEQTHAAQSLLQAFVLSGTDSP